jgi:hypothetical protein
MHGYGNVVSGWGQAEADRYSGAPADAAVSPSGLRSVWEEAGRNSGRGFCGRALEGTKPKGASGGRYAKHVPQSQGTLGRVKAQEPGPIGPAQWGGTIGATPRDYR